MKRQIATLMFNGVHYRIIEDGGVRTNPYRVIAEFYEATENGSKHRYKQIERYADLESALRLLAEIVHGDFKFNDLMEYLG